MATPEKLTSTGEMTFSDDSYTGAMKMVMAQGDDDEGLGETLRVGGTASLSRSHRPARPGRRSMRRLEPLPASYLDPPEGSTQLPDHAATRARCAMVAIFAWPSRSASSAASVNSVFVDD